MRALVLGVVGLCACDKVFGLDGRVEPVDAPIDMTSLDEGLVAWFTMDSIDTDLRDQSGNGLVGICSNGKCPTTASDGKVNGALHFDGTMAVGVNSKPVLETTEGFSIAGWYRIAPEAALVFACPFNKVSTGGNNSWQLCFFPDALGQSIQFYTDSGGMDVSLPGGNVPLDTYVHIVLWWDKTDKRIYVNGLQTGIAPGDTMFADGVLAIGADYDSGTAVVHFQGDIDDLRVYDRPLAVDEITRLLQLGGP